MRQTHLDLSHYLHMSLGPVEMIVIGFPGSQFTGAVAPALADVIDRGLVRVIDLVFLTKVSDDEVVTLELSGVDEDVRTALEPLVDEVTGAIGEEDVEDLSDALEAGDSAAVLLFEHVWAKGFADSLRDAGGELVFSMHVPRELVEAATAGD